MTSTKFYIIGNGFDLHHGIKSKYSDFGNWLSKFSSDLYYKINEVYECCYVDLWSDFENQLASLDIVQYSLQKAAEYRPNLMSDHCDRMWEDAKYAAEQELDELFNGVRDCFHDWIKQLNAPLESQRIKLDTENSYFLNFNYSKTLEDMYHVSPSQILHIHGCVDGDENFILGHGKSYEYLKSIIHRIPENLSSDELHEYYEEESRNFEFHEQLAEEATLGKVASQQKPVNLIIEKNESFFDSLDNITNVYVYGLSLSEVDMPYLNLIASKTCKANWQFNDYKNNNKEKIECFCKNNHIQNYSIINLDQLKINTNNK